MHADLRGIAVRRVPSRGDQVFFERAAKGLSTRPTFRLRTAQRNLGSQLNLNAEKI